LKAHGLTDKQSVELCDNIGKMLVLELESETVKAKVKKLVADYVKENKIDTDPTRLSDKLHWHVQVLLKNKPALTVPSQTNSNHASVGAP